MTHLHPKSTSADIAQHTYAPGPAEYYEDPDVKAQRMESVVSLARRTAADTRLDAMRRRERDAPVDGFMAAWAYVERKGNPRSGLVRTWIVLTFVLASIAGAALWVV